MSKLTQIKYEISYRGSRRLIRADDYVSKISPDGLLRFTYGHPNKHVKDSMHLEHNLIMEQHLGRLLTPKEFVVHLNDDKLDNKISNLSLKKDIEVVRKQAVLATSRQNDFLKISQDILKEVKSLKNEKLNFDSCLLSDIFSFFNEFMAALDFYSNSESYPQLVCDDYGLKARFSKDSITKKLSSLIIKNRSVFPDEIKNKFIIKETR